MASDHSSAYGSCSWKHPESIRIEGVTRHPRVHTRHLQLSTHLLLKNHTTELSCTAAKANPICFQLLSKEPKNPSPLACMRCPLHHKEGAKIRIYFLAVMQEHECQISQTAWKSLGFNIPALSFF